MKKSGNIVSYTAAEIDAMLARGEDTSDPDAAAAMTEEELEAAIASDPDEAGIVWDEDSLSVALPKAPISIRLDPDVLAFFRGGGRGYQTKINAVLRSYMEAVTRGGR